MSSPFEWILFGPCSLLRFLTLLTIASFEPYSTTTTAQEHMCYKLRTPGHPVSLKSFTHYRSNELVMFEGGGQYHMTVSSNQFASNNQLPLPEVVTRWDTGFLADSVSALTEVTSDGRLDGVHFLPFNDVRRIKDPEWKDLTHFISKAVAGIAVTTDEWVHMHRWSYDRLMGNRLEHRWKHRRLDYPNFTVLNRVDATELGAFVLHQDIYDRTSDYILYDLVIDSESLEWNVHTHNATAGERAAALFYYVHKTHTADQVRLVPRPNRRYLPPSMLSDSPDKRNLLVGPAVAGFVLGSQMVLFDARMACVYVLGDFDPEKGSTMRRKYWEQKHDLWVSRTNIPFERFFRCGGDAQLPTQGNPKRCDHTSNDEPDIPVWNSPGEEDSPVEHPTSVKSNPPPPQPPIGPQTTPPSNNHKPNNQESNSVTTAAAITQPLFVLNANALLYGGPLVGVAVLLLCAVVCAATCVLCRQPQNNNHRANNKYNKGGQHHRWFTPPPPHSLYSRPWSAVSSMVSSSVGWAMPNTAHNRSPTPIKTTAHNNKSPLKRKLQTPIVSTPSITSACTVSSPATSAAKPATKTPKHTTTTTTTRTTVRSPVRPTPKLSPKVSPKKVVGKL